MPQAVNKILQKNLNTTRNPTSTRTSHATEGIQWIRMEELGKALTNTCRAVRRIQELLKLGASSSHNLFQSLITNQDLLRLREDIWPSHKTQRKGWWCRAFATAINRQCPTCNRLWTTEQFPPSLTQCLACSKTGAKKKPSQFKLLDDEVGLIFRSALPED